MLVKVAGTCLNPHNFYKESISESCHSVSAGMQSENDTSNSEHVMGSNSHKRSYTLLQGHSGPVHSTTFSPLGDFILSSSADSSSTFSLSAINQILSSYLVSTTYDLPLNSGSSVMEHKTEH